MIKTLFPILIHTSLVVIVIDGANLKRNLGDTWKFITVKDLINASFVYLIHLTKTKIHNKKRNKLGLRCAKLRPAWPSYQLLCS